MTLKRALLASTAVGLALLALDAERQQRLKQIFIPNAWSRGTVGVNK